MPSTLPLFRHAIIITPLSYSYNTFRTLTPVVQKQAYSFFHLQKNLIVMYPL